MECLKTARLYSEVAKQLIRMTNEESDLRSALLLEQAAYCFLVTQPPMHRKYAFHIVLVCRPIHFRQDINQGKSLQVAGETVQVLSTDRHFRMSGIIILHNEIFLF